MVVQTKSCPASENIDAEENSENSKSKSEAAANILNLMKKRNKSMLKNSFDSLEILRMNIQNHFNQQVEVLMNDVVEKFFHPAIENIKENTDEKIDDKQIKKICRNLLEDCVRTKYSNETILNIKPIIKTDDDSSESATSLLHQALKRKRTESETENLYKRQFFITAAANSFNAAIAPQSNQQKPSLLTSALTSPPKAMRHTGNPTRPIFHLIPTNRNLKSTHVELLNLLKQNSALPAIKTSEGLKIATATAMTVNTNDSESNNSPN